jgi:hypothetical protein
MFVKIAMDAKEASLAQVLDCVLDTDVWDEMWFQTVKALADALNLRPDISIELATIKGRLWDMAFDAESDQKEIARKTLIAVTAIRPRLEEYTKTLTTVTEKELDMDDFVFCVRLFQEIFGAKNFKIPYDYALQAVNRCIDRIKQSDQVPTALFEFVESCYTQKLHIDEATILELNEIKRPRFYPFFSALCENRIIDSSALEKIVSIIPPCEHEADFYIFVKRLIVFNNCGRDNIVAVPLMNQDLIWELATGESPMRPRFAKLLCRLYASNDGVTLPDADVINYFLEIWSAKSLNADAIAIDLLTLFISKWEDVTETFIKRRAPDTHKVKVTAHCVEPDFTIKFDATRDSTAGLIAAHVANVRDLKHRTICIVYDQSETMIFSIANLQLRHALPLPVPADDAEPDPGARCGTADSEGAPKIEG